MAQPRACWISGNRAECKATLAKIKASIGECEQITFDAYSDLAALEGAVMTNDMFGGKKLILITGLPDHVGSRQTFVSGVKRLISSVPPDCLLVFWGIPPEDERAIYAYVAKEGKAFDFASVVPLVDAEQLLQKRLVEAGKEATSEVTMQLLRKTTVGEGKTYGIDQVALLADKVIAYLGTRKILTDEDVRALATGEEIVNVWQLFDAIDAKQYEHAQVIVNRLVACETQGDWKMLCFKLLNVCLWRYRMLVFVRECQVSKMLDDEIVKQATVLTKFKIEGTQGNMKSSSDGPAYTERQIRTALGAGFMGSPLEKYTRKRLFAILDFVQEALEETRYVVSGDAGYRLTIELLLMLACDVIDDNRRRKLWQFFRYDDE